MSVQLFNRCFCGSLILTAVSVGLLSCGGGADQGNGSPLPSGSQLDMSIPVTSDAGAQFTCNLQVFGNNTDLPLVKVNASSGTGSANERTLFIYRRSGNSKTATVSATLEFMSGQVVLPGPIVRQYYNDAIVEMTITFDDPSAGKDTAGTCSGTAYITASTDVGGAELIVIPYRGTQGTVKYTVQQ